MLLHYDRFDEVFRYVTVWVKDPELVKDLHSIELEFRRTAKKVIFYYVMD